jgi:peptide/nickel transport system substrate-binding protein
MGEQNYWTKLAGRPATRRRVLASAAIGAAGIAMASCSSAGKKSQSAGTAGQASSQNTGTPQGGGTFSGYLGSNFPLDPHKLSGSAHVVTAGVYSRVFRYKSGPDPKVYTDHDSEPDLGLSAESPDAITWTVKLRTDAKFQNIAPVNGHPVEAEDVKATFTRALDPVTGSPNRGTLNMIDPAQIQTPDKQTVVFKLNYPYAPLPRLLASPDYSLIVPREALTGSYDLSKTVIGSGPFILDSVTPDVAYVYKRNPDYYEKGRPYVDGMRIAIIPDTAQQLAQFASGNLDEIVIDNPADLATVKRANPKATVLKGDDGRPNPLYFQLGDPTSSFQDVRVRRALSMAIDHDAFGKAFYDGELIMPVMIPAYMGKWSLKVGDLDQTLAQYYKYNPAESKKLLEAAGAANLQLKVLYVTGGNFTPLSAKQAEAVANMYNSVGIKTTLVQQDYNKDFVDSGHGSRQGFFDKDAVAYVGMAAYTEADDWLFSYLHPKSTTNQEHLNDPAVGAMIDKERTLVNEAERLKAVQDIERYVADKMYILVSGGSYKYSVIQPRVQGYAYSDAAGKHAETYAKLWLRQ